MGKQVIIAMSGRKGAGKNTIAQFIKKYWIEKSCCTTQNEDECFECSFADNLKQFCIETLGLDYSQCYGSDYDKNTPTKYRWEDVMPHLRWKFGSRQKIIKAATSNNQTSTYDCADRDSTLRDFYDQTGIPIGLREGPMSGRDIMQIFGTELIRETFGNVWAEATIRTIKRMNKPLSIITDNRFPNEIQAILAEPHGYIIRLTRSPFGTIDIHPSESALDDFDWDRERCFVLENKRLNEEQQNESIIPILNKIFAGV